VLDLALVAAVAAVVREGSFERAAQAMNLTASAVSQRVKLLEERLGAVLVVRGKPCLPTDAGAHLCRYAELVGLLTADLRRALPGVAAPESAAEVPALRVAVNADSLGTWFMAAVPAFTEAVEARLEVLVDDQDHTADWLRRGHVLAAVTSLGTAVQGCRSRRLGALRYVAVCSPAFRRRWFGGGVGAEALARAPSLRFDRKDMLQAQWARRLLRRPLELPAHALPATQAFLDAMLAGVGWGMGPWLAVREHLREGRLVELVPGRPLDVPLHWQVARLPVPALDALTRTVVAASAQLRLAAESEAAGSALPAP
jgi:LysR family transcriptional regulator (chromosome initiation inhibitor)